jgi:hypothetical protein
MVAENDHRASNFTAILANRLNDINRAERTANIDSLLTERCPLVEK